MSRALSCGGRRSLFIFDEFGKGTLAADGTALLLGLVDNLMKRGERAPLALLSTHYHQVIYQLNF